MKGRMVPAAAPIRKLRVVGRSRRNAGFCRWKRPVSASLHRGLAAPGYDFALGIGDELVSYTVKKPRKSPTRYYAHSNHLYSVATITNQSGSVVERWSYNAYGVPTIKNSANATIAKSAVGNDRGFTGYKLDGESADYFAKNRFYKPRLGIFSKRDPGKLIAAANFRWSNPMAGDGYSDGFNGYSAYLVPNKVDPLGLKSVPSNGDSSIDKDPKTGIYTVTVAKCEIVVIIDHGGSSPNHNWTFPYPNCSGGGFVGCFPEDNNPKPGTGVSVIPSLPWTDEVFDRDPGYMKALEDALKPGGGIDSAAKSICSGPCGCKEIKVTVVAPDGLPMGLNGNRIVPCP
jgi:hypothetical protein